MNLIHLEPLPPRTTKGDILGFLCATGNIRREQVGRIDLGGATAVIEVPSECVTRLVKALDGASLKGRRLRGWTTTEKTAQGPGEDHFQRLVSLLALEADAEAQQTLEGLRRLPAAEAERTGDCLAGLVITEESSGLGGRCLLSLAKRNRSLALPWNRLEPGTPVLLAPENGVKAMSWRALVCERLDNAVRIALSEPPEEEDRPATYRLDRAGDEVARQRQRAALERARAAQGDRLARLRDVLLGDTPPAFDPEAPLAPLDNSLNAAQQAAVRFALAARELAIIHGPPGTGKTTAVVELIRQAVGRGDKVLVCAPSNLAVDNVLERLLADGASAVRLGHPARVLAALREHTLDLMVEDHDDTRLARKLTREAFASFRKAAKYTRARPEPGARRDLRQEARAMLADARRLEAQVVEHVLDRAAVLCATTTGLDSEVLGQRQFDLAVIDEAGQSTEPGCWVPLPRCHRLVLAGDHCQLPPTVISLEAARQGLGVSLMERLVNLHGPAVTRRLDVQYRMHEAIMAFPSAQFYEGTLQADATVRGHLLCDLPGVADSELTRKAVHFIDTAGAGYDEEREPEGASRHNPQEAELVSRKVRELLSAGVPAEAVGIITPYAAQVRLLRDLLPVVGLEIDSVDGFQGREKEAVVLSLVRSNREGEVGFLADVRRLNVALTRARRMVLVVGDSATLACHPVYQALLDYVEEIGAYHSVWEEDSP